MANTKLENTQEELEEEAARIRDVINTKESKISAKEEEINRIKKFIEMETSDKERDITQMSRDIEE